MRRDLLDGQPKNQKRAIAVPSPRGEGQVEGGRKTQTQFCGNI
jgi:hypothetical protein